MNNIANNHLLGLPTDRLKVLIRESNELKRHYCIWFYIEQVQPQYILIRITQSMLESGAYLSPEKLAKITNELFAKFVPDKLIHVVPQPYNETWQNKR